MSKVRIVNWLLTRKCNLNCEYCAIVKNYRDMPKQYPEMKYYIKNEMPTHVVINALKAFKIHNLDVFHIFYGGEPLLRTDLAEIINYCNDNEIYYTIISNNTPEIQPLIKKLFNKVDHIEGFTSSVDPVFNEMGNVDDRVKKSIVGLQKLKEMQGGSKVKDVVAEITVMHHNQNLLYKLINELSSEEIYSDITFVDIAKSRYYDFSNIYEESALVQPTFKLAEELLKIMNDENLLVHMKDVLIPKMFDTLPSNFNCELEHGLHNITIDADGTIRLCLRIRGTVTPMCHVSKLFDSSQPPLINKNIYNAIKYDKKAYCKLCNHSCLMMSQYFDKSKEKVDTLVHSDKRG